jgi:HAD superfamily hydrolase (TIGR01450 family)
MKEHPYRSVLADLDGTVNRGPLLIEGARHVYNELSKRGIRWMFLSNNATSLAADLADRISKLGLEVTEQQFLNSATAVLHALKSDHRGARIMVVGEPRLIKAVDQAGCIVEDDPLNTEIVLVALDKGFTYEKLKRAHMAIQHGAAFWATNLDATFPIPGGFLPGAGSVVAAIATAAGRPPERVFGKPSPDMAFLALDILGRSAESCLVVGDRMETDVLFARNAHMDSALVLTGATSRADLDKYDYTPDYVFESIADIHELFL